MEKATKEDVRFVAKCLRDHLPISIDFGFPGQRDTMTAEATAEFVRPLDKQLADKLQAWQKATTELASYCRDRLGDHPMYGNADIFVPRKGISSRDPSSNGNEA